MKIAVLTPRPDYPVEWRWAYDVEADALAATGATVVPRCWMDPVAAGEFDLVMPLVAWGYHQRFGDWLAVLDRLERDAAPVQNPVPLLRWNSDKAYLSELYDAGISVVPTHVADALDNSALQSASERFGSDDLVVKPLVSASAFNTYRLGRDEAVPDAVRGTRMMVQPWLRSIQTSGEWSLIFFGGNFSHAVAKVPQPGEFRVQPEYGGIITRCDPPVGATALAQAALSAAPAPALYARVDIVAGNDGALQVIELELIEPALFLGQAPDAVATFAQAVASVVEGARE
ncbi:hypothetical protein H8M03_10450 [Sphingomonas sabuli]|uniref:ATP-grasp domain-containing protein n=1 Tax=Sphingomonas sabuli TaxID=2764186 RepID=A0A7G9L1C5_9SPHN|nr:hypothetical protein [Sphingomonas sabuli]QNM82424.1 hypothetical protein H8M03_10450 [Sphingomonas sabuli]